MTHTPAPTLLSGVGGFERAAPTAAEPEKKMRHAPVGFGLASSSLRLTALLSYACIATVVTKGPYQEAGAGCQHPCTSRSVPTRALCFSAQIVIITRSPGTAVIIFTVVPRDGADGAAPREPGTTVKATLPSVSPRRVRGLQRSQAPCGNPSRTHTEACARV